MRLVMPSDVPAAVAEVVAGSGQVIAPLPSEKSERGAALAMLRPDQPEPTPDAAFVVATSGSTGRPKGVVLTRSAVIAAAEAAHVRLGGPGRWTCLLPVSYVAGLMVVVRSEVAGAAARIVTDGVIPAAGDERSYLSIVPTQLHRALREPGSSAALASYDAVLVGGAPLPREVRDQAAIAGIRVVTTYGATETCGGVVYDGVPLGGVTVDLAEGERILLEGPTTFSGYRLDPEATAAVLRGRTFATSDRGSWDGQRLTVLGRLDDVVISGGINVDLAALQRVVDEVYGAERVVVFAVPDQTWGQRIVAVTTASGVVEGLRGEVAGKVAKAAVPKEVRLVVSLPRLASGKIDRRALARGWSEGA